MLIQQKQNLIVVSAAFVIVVLTVAAPYTKMFGRIYDHSKEFYCCKGGQLYLHRYYKQKFCWINISQSYSDSAIGKPSGTGCNIDCPLDGQ
jgi:hypothetical protein